MYFLEICFMLFWVVFHLHSPRDFCFKLASLVLHAASLSSHSFPYVFPSLPQTGSYWLEHKKSHTHVAVLFRILHTEPQQHFVVSQGETGITDSEHWLDWSI